MGRYLKCPGLSPCDRCTVLARIALLKGNCYRLFRSKGALLSTPPDLSVDDNVTFSTDVHRLATPSAGAVSAVEDPGHLVLGHALCVVCFLYIVAATQAHVQHKLKVRTARGPMGVSPGNSAVTSPLLVRDSPKPAVTARTDGEERRRDQLAAGHPWLSAPRLGHACHTPHTDTSTPLFVTRADAAAGNTKRQQVACRQRHGHRHTHAQTQQLHNTRTRTADHSTSARRRTHL